jgi:hypothetical protein
VEIYSNLNYIDFPELPINQRGQKIMFITLSNLRDQNLVALFLCCASLFVSSTLLKVGFLSLAFFAFAYGITLIQSNPGAYSPATRNSQHLYKWASLAWAAVTASAL